MSDTKKTEQESTGIVIRKTKEVKSKYPAFVKWIAGIIAAILMAGIGFFGGIFGLDEAQQSKLKQMITSSSVYQEAISDAPAAPTDEKTEVKK
ncbi:MAG: hypothetical protein IKA36_00055 [Clostridia bacterium]|nr:hypothetical protein [Clostridia bacterium]